MRPRRPELWLLVALAAVVRFYGLRFGMPHVWARPDELAIADIAKEFLRGDLNPHFWDYPSLFMYILGALYYGYYLLGRVFDASAGWFDSREQFLGLWRFDWTSFFMIGRFVSAVAGTATVVLVHRAAERLFDRLTAGVAASFMALAFLHVRDSHFGTTDVSMTFFVVLSFLFLLRAALDDRPAAFAWAGVAAGAGASIKYNAALMAASLVAALVVVAAGRGAPLVRGTRIRWAIRGGVVFTVCFAAVFLAGSPYALLDHRPFIEGLIRQSRHVATPHGFDLGPGGIYHVVFSLRYGLGVPLLASGGAGLVWSFRSRWQRGLLLASFPMAYYLVLVPSRTVFVRYAIPLVPFLCIGAAWFVTQAVGASARRFRMSIVPAVCAFALLVVTPSAVSVAQIDRLFAETDNRLVAADWIRAHVPRNSTVYFAGNIVVQPIVDLIPGVRTLRYLVARGGTTFVEDRPAPGRAPEPDLKPEWIVIPETGVPEYTYRPPDIEALLAREYRVAAVLTAMDLEGNRFDRQDAFFYPYAGFRNVRRGGPNYVVYARTP